MWRNLEAWSFFFVAVVVGVGVTVFIYWKRESWMAKMKTALKPEAPTKAEASLVTGS